MVRKHFPKSLVVLAVGAVVAAGAERSVAEGPATHDWPMWRYDAGRGATTLHALDEELHLQWVLEMPAPQRAWPEQIDDHGKSSFDTPSTPKRPRCAGSIRAWAPIRATPIATPRAPSAPSRPRDNWPSPATASSSPAEGPRRECSTGTPARSPFSLVYL